ncbi:MAG: hypothetical protein KBT75_11075 [Oleispira antarctica]|nr:hypothetical protein [Oleispira antarctica]MBQ0792880.1 hypothetical protein [Oleispira antarctica]
MNKNIIAAIILSSASTLAFAGMEHRGGHSPGMKKFSLIDTNGDESLSKEEVINFHTLHFTEMDADNDGLVSKSEMKSYKKQQHRGKKCSKGKKGSKGSDTE